MASLRIWTGFARGYTGGMAEGTGLRERKRVRTRRALHEAALRLFLARGFDDVTVAEVAEEADVALTTLFSYFPAGKVGLVFEQEEDRAAALLQAIQDRPANTDPLQAVEAFMESRLPFQADDARSRDVLALVYTTPQLRAYVRAKWTDCEDELTSVLAEARPDADGMGLRALARFALEAPDVAAREASPRETLVTIFKHLRRGWGYDSGA